MSVLNKYPIGVFDTQMGLQEKNTPSTARQRQCGLSWLRGRNFSPSSRAGYSQALGVQQVYRLHQFELVVAKLWHAFTCIPAGVGLLSPCNWILKLHPAFVYLHTNRNVLNEIKGCQSLLWESTLAPTQCRKLTCGWQDYIGIVDASSYGIGGVVFGELSACTPTVFRWQSSEEIHTNIKTSQNWMGTISDLDLEMVGLLMLWLAIEGVCGPLQEKCITLICDNSPLIGWATCLTSKWSMVAKHLVQALAMCLKIQRACQLTPIHIEGKHNAIADIPLCSFRSNLLWKCETDSDLLTLLILCFIFPVSNCGQSFAWIGSWLHAWLQPCRWSISSWTAGGNCPNREARWRHWCGYVRPLGVDPYLQHTPFQTRVRCLTGFAARTRLGYWLVFILCGTKNVAKKSLQVLIRRVCRSILIPT